ncbi:MAG: hypothetical protein K8H86_11145 [Ignavibacteriaceae bacterium]|nr:hypothetical protein [Ignavibacteriaceae bacterium]
MRIFKSAIIKQPQKVNYFKFAFGKIITNELNRHVKLLATWDYTASKVDELQSFFL